MVVERSPDGAGQQALHPPAARGEGSVVRLDVEVRGRGAQRRRQIGETPRLAAQAIVEPQVERSGTRAPVDPGTPRPRAGRRRARVGLRERRGEPGQKDGGRPGPGEGAS